MRRRRPSRVPTGCGLRVRLAVLATSSASRVSASGGGADDHEETSAPGQRIVEPGPEQRELRRSAAGEGVAAARPGRVPGVRLPAGRLRARDPARGLRARARAARGVGLDPQLGEERTPRRSGMPRALRPRRPRAIIERRHELASAGAHAADIASRVTRAAARARRGGRARAPPRSRSCLRRDVQLIEPRQLALVLRMPRRRSPTNGAPRQSASAASELLVPRRRGRSASAARPSASRRSKRSRSSSSGLERRARRRRRPSGSCRAAAPSVRAETQFWSTLAAVGGGFSPQSSSTMTSLVRVSFPWRSRRARTARCRRAAERDRSLAGRTPRGAEDAVVHRGSPEPTTVSGS